MKWWCAAGTLKDDQHCYLCGQNGHRQFECPNQPEEIYQLPNAVQEKVQQQYERDVARMAGPGESIREAAALLCCLSAVPAIVLLICNEVTRHPHAAHAPRKAYEGAHGGNAAACCFALRSRRTA